MERWTMRNDCGLGIIRDPAHTRVIKAIDRLAAYEDTDRTPDEIEKLKKKALSLEVYKAIGTTEHLRELVEAEQEGRLVVLPVKPGTKVYTTRWWDDVPETCTDSRGKKFQRMTQRHKVTEEEFLPFSLDYIQFGERVFLTREEAEKALGGGGSNEDR